MKSDFEVLKKHYGENFAKLARSLFPTILEEPGKLTSIIEDNFAHSHFLYDDIVRFDRIDNFKNFIMKKYSENQEYQIDDDIERPEVLFDKAGYKLYKCKTDEDVKSFMHYYKHGEELCTFRDPDRINRYHIFWAVKNNVDEIKRENFKTPRRQDEYGTSVISLQFSKGDSSVLSIKNRYNHTVDNPDATFSNDLENIHAGLTDSFEKYYGINLRDSRGYDFELPYYTRANDGRFYKFNREIDNIYYCPNNIIIDNGKVITLDKSRYAVLDYYVFDKVKKQVLTYKQFRGDYEKLEDGDDGFTKLMNGNISKFEWKKLPFDNIEYAFSHTDGSSTSITLDKNGQMIKFATSTSKDIENDFLRDCTELKSFSAPNVKHIKNYCLYKSNSLEEIDVPSLEVVGHSFLRYAPKLTEFNAPKLERMGYDCLYNAGYLSSVNLDSIKSIGSSSLKYNIIENLSLPNVIEIYDNVLEENSVMTKISMPNAIVIGNFFLMGNTSLEEFNADNVEEIGTAFLESGGNLKKINLPKLKKVGSYFMEHNDSLEEARFDSATKIGEKAFEYNNTLKNLYIPKVIEIEHDFLTHNNSLEVFDAPSVESIYSNVLRFNNKIQSLKFDNVKFIGSSFMEYGQSLKTLKAEKLEHVGSAFLHNQKNLEIVDTPNLTEIVVEPETFLRKAKRLKFFNSRLSKDCNVKNKKVKKFIRKQEKERLKREEVEK